MGRISTEQVSPTEYSDKNATTVETDSASSDKHVVTNILAVDTPAGEPTATIDQVDAVDKAKTGPFAFFKTRNFWIILLLGQVLSLCDTGTNVLSSFLVSHNVSLPAFQNLPNYAVLGIGFTSYTIYKYGFQGWAKMVLKYGPRYFVYSFMDVQGNYFTVFAYRYTNQLSAQLINFWAIVIVVVLSFLLLKVRYHWSRILGILICIGGMGILLASDKIQHRNDYSAPNKLKGDLFALVGATFYGLTNTFEEYLTSKRPLYEVVGQIGFWGTFIAGVQSAIFERHDWQHAQWSGATGGYLVGYTAILVLFYCLAPIMFRMSSAALFNLSLLTGNFWGLVTGITLLHLTVHYLYPIAFVLIIIGLFIYFIDFPALGESRKPWLGADQAAGVSGIGTAKRAAERGQVNVV